jgi:hypothetical protein
MPTPYDGKLYWWHWKGDVVPYEAVRDLAADVVKRTPNVAGICVKSSNGALWQGEWGDDKRSMAIMGLQSIQDWAGILDEHGLELHLWAVLRGEDIEGEIHKVIQASNVQGVRSMILDVEAGERYFGSQPAETVAQMAQTIRQSVREDFHIGLCLFTRDDEPQQIHIDRWLPHVDSLHPMVYHWDFSEGSGQPEPYIDQAFETLQSYGLPVVPLLGTYPDPTSGRFPPPEHAYDGAMYARQKGAAGVGYFRLGDAAVLEAQTIEAVAKVRF